MDVIAALEALRFPVAKVAAGRYGSRCPKCSGRLVIRVTPGGEIPRCRDGCALHDVLSKLAGGPPSPGHERDRSGAGGTGAARATATTTKRTDQ